METSRNDDQQVMEPAETQEAAVEKPRDKWKIAAIAGFLITLSAWIVLVSSDICSLTCGAVGLIVSCFGTKSSSRGWKDLAITSIVASAVLLLVFAIFWGAIIFALKSL